MQDGPGPGARPGLLARHSWLRPAEPRVYLRQPVTERGRTAGGASTPSRLICALALLASARRVIRTELRDRSALGKHRPVLDSGADGSEALPAAGGRAAFIADRSPEPPACPGVDRPTHARVWRAELPRPESEPRLTRSQGSTWDPSSPQFRACTSTCERIGRASTRSTPPQSAVPGHGPGLGAGLQHLGGRSTYLVTGWRRLCVG
jgi:hypothetical protein